MEKADIGLIGLGMMGHNLPSLVGKIQSKVLPHQGMEGCSMEPYRSWKRRKCSGGGGEAYHFASTSTFHNSAISTSICLICIAFPSLFKI
jgi:hypothetical protein